MNVALILSAGRGERLRPLTDTIPKPLIKAGGHRLIEYHLDRLRQAGYSKAVVNLAYKGELIRSMLGNGARYGLNIVYSDESGQRLETGGGILNALPLIESEHFTIVNADIWTDFDFACLPAPPPIDGHLILVDNPEHHQGGDFEMQSNGTIRLPSQTAESTLTYAGIAILTKRMFVGWPLQAFPLREVLYHHIKRKRITASHHKGQWFDIGTIDRLNQLQATLATGRSIGE